MVERQMTQLKIKQRHKEYFTKETLQMVIEDMEAAAHHTYERNTKPQQAILSVTRMDETQKVK